MLHKVCPCETQNLIIPPLTEEFLKGVLKQIGSTGSSQEWQAVTQFLALAWTGTSTT